MMLMYEIICFQGFKEHPRDLVVRWPSGGLFGNVGPVLDAQEHCRETLIGHVDVKSFALMLFLTPKGSDGQVAVLEDSRGNAGPTLRAQ